MTIPPIKCPFGDHQVYAGTALGFASICDKHPPVEVWFLGTGSSILRIQIKWQEPGHFYEVNFGGFLDKEFYYFTIDGGRYIKIPKTKDLLPEQFPNFGKRIHNLMAFL